MIMFDVEHEHETMSPRESVEPDRDLEDQRALLLRILDRRRRRRPTRTSTGWELAEAGYHSLRALAEAIPISHEVLSNVRSGAYPLGPKLRARIAELIDVDPVWVLIALRRKPGPRWRW